MKKIKHKLVIITSATLLRLCDAIIASNITASRVIGKVVKTTARKLTKKRYLKVSKPS